MHTQASLRIAEICGSLEFSSSRPHIHLSGGTRVPSHVPCPIPAPGSTDSILIRLASSYLTSHSKHRPSLQPLKLPLQGSWGCLRPEIWGP